MWSRNLSFWNFVNLFPSPNRVSRLSNQRTHIKYIMTSAVNMDNLQAKAELANKLLENLKKELVDIKNIKIENRIKELSVENESLRNEVATALIELVKLETINGKPQIPIPGQESCAPQSVTPVLKSEPIVEKSNVPEGKPAKEPKQPKEPKAKAPAKKTAPEETELPIDVGRLDMRIGRIVEIAKHPDADSLYVEKIDCGEAAPRTVVSGLVKHVPIEEMQNRLVVVLCNLKPAKMRGVTSEAMVMCASSAEKVEVLSPPEGAIPGDLVHCDGFTRNPDAQLNPKKKIFETCAPDLLTNDSKEACFKGANLNVPGKGKIIAQTLAGVNVR